MLEWLPAIGNLVGAGVNYLTGKSNQDKQEEFAKSGITWKVEDAKRAGINPLAALGAQTSHYSPVSFGDTAAALGNAGQDISRAINATRTSEQRVDAVQKTVTDLNLTNLRLKNDLLAAQIAKINQGQNPPMPSPEQRWLIDGQGNVQIKDAPMERQGHAPGQPHLEAGAVTDLGYSRTTGGGYFPSKSKDLMDRMDDDTLGSLVWNYRNRILPSVGINQSPPAVKVPEGYDDWVYHPFYQEYRPMRRPKWLGPLGKYFYY